MNKEKFYVEFAVKVEAISEAALYLIVNDWLEKLYQTGNMPEGVLLPRQLHTGQWKHPFEFGIAEDCDEEK